jgi:hypothetical protein
MTVAALQNKFDLRRRRFGCRRQSAHAAKFERCAQKVVRRSSTAMAA